MPIILKEGECVHCKTQKEYDAVLKVFNERGFFYCTDKNNRVNRFNTYKEKTCLRTSFRTDDIKYCNIEYYHSENFRIYTFEEFMDDKKEKTYTQKEVDAIIAETRKKTIDEVIERLEALNAQVLNIPENIRSSTPKCKNCGRFINKIMGCKHCNK